MNLRKLDEKEALQFSDVLLSLYFEKRDMNTLSCHLEERTSWIGTGEGEVCKNLIEAGVALEEELMEYQGSFCLVDTSLTFESLTDYGGIVYGMVRAIPNDHTLSDEDIRFSVVMEQTETGPKLVHIHFSHADIVQKKGGYFVKQGERADNQSLRAELNIRELQLANLTKNIPGGAHQCANDEELTLLSMSDEFLSMFGYVKKEIDTLFEGKFLNMVHPNDKEMLLKTLYEQLEHGSEIELEYRVIQKEGHPIWVLDKGRLMDDGSGATCFYCLLVDITKRKVQQEELRLSLERHKVILDQATDIIFEWDILGDTLEFSANWTKRFGYEPISKEISKQIPLSENIHPEDMPAFVKIMKDTAAGVPYSEAEFRICNLKRKYYWCRIRATTQYDTDGCPIKAIGVITDIDEEKKQKQELILQAQYDTLTGIYNKATINALVERRMQEQQQPKREQDVYHALMIVDVDHFKSVNDNYGHLCGDSVLSDVAKALEVNVRGCDLVGRIGGDEFLVYLPEVAGEQFVQNRIEEIMQALSSIRPERGALPITCSIGVAVIPSEEKEYQELYHLADSALYLRKNNGRDGFTFYRSEMGEMVFNTSVTAVSNSIVSEEGNVVDEWLAQYAFRMLYDATDIEDALNRLLEIIGRSFTVNRVYIFETSKDSKDFVNTFVWSGDELDAKVEPLNHVSHIENVAEYANNFDDRGVFYCCRIDNLNPDFCSVLKAQNVCSMLQCSILDEGEFVGYIGFDEFRKSREWNERQIGSFKLVANVLSIFLLKLRQKQKINDECNQHKKGDFQ